MHVDRSDSHDPLPAEQPLEEDNLPNGQCDYYHHFQYAIGSYGALAHCDQFSMDVLPVLLESLESGNLS